MATNKNSLYVQSLVSFLNDTKPYHSKITEVIEEYRFFDEMLVSMEERFFNKLKMKSSWPYSFFSSGPGSNFIFPIHHVLNTNLRRGKFNVSQTNHDLPGVPYAFDPKSMSGAGIKDAFVQRGGSEFNAQPLLEGHDIFQSHGAFVFSIKQTMGSNQVGTFEQVFSVADAPFPIVVNLSFVAESLIITGPAREVTPTSIEVTGPGAVKVFGLNSSPVYGPQYKELKNQSLFAHITDATQQLALDVSNPASAVSRLMALMSTINQRIIATPLAILSRAAFDATTATLPKNVTLNGNNDSVVETPNIRVNGDIVRFMVVPPNSGLVVGSTYYVIAASASAFRVSLSPGGSAVNITASGAAIIAPVQALDLPRSYEALIIALEAEGVSVPAGYTSWSWANKKVTFSAEFNEVQQPGHTRQNGSSVAFYEMSGNTNIVQGTTYFVVNRTSSTYQLAFTAGGSPIDITGSGAAYSTRRASVNGVPTQRYVDLDISALSPGLYFNQYTDIGQRESGRLRYSNVNADKIVVSNITANTDAVDYEEWTLVANSSTTLLVVGSSSGAVGVIAPTTAGAAFVTPHVSFTVTGTGELFEDGDEYKLTPDGEVTIHKDAPLEVWSVIKVNPLAYSRPAFQSTRFGYLQDVDGRRDFITVLDPAFPQSTVIIRAITPTEFEVTNSAEPGYVRTAFVDTLFSDGRLQFTIVGSAEYDFRAGDTFFVQIENDASTVQDLGLYYGYDAGPFDSSNTVYNTVSSMLDDYLRPIDFHYDSRFLSYNLDAFNLSVSPGTPEGEYRLRAEADLTRPLQMPTSSTSLLDPLLVRVASTSNIVAAGVQTVDGVVLVDGDLVLLKNQTLQSMNGVYRVATLGLWTRVEGYPTTGTTPFSERPDLHVILAVQGNTNAGTYWKRVLPYVDHTYEQTSDLNDMPNDVSYEGAHSATDLDLTPDILLWYAETFALERFDTVLGAWVTVTSGIQINSAHSNAALGLSFTIVPAAKPFIAARVTSTTFVNLTGTQQTATVDTGDTVYFRVLNNPPQQVSAAGLTSLNVPRLIMHGDSYHSSIPALWTLNWLDDSTYTIQGVHTADTWQVGQQVFPTPLVINTASAASYLNRDLGIHWTVVAGAVGFAAGDQFTFETFSRKPSYLVHGSVSGWQADAEIGEWYWNGKIGFLIRAPILTVFQNNTELVNGGPVSILKVRPDMPSCVYRVVATTNGRWILYRNGELVAHGEVLLDDQNVRLQMPVAVAGTEFVIRVVSDTHDLAIGVDLAIVRTDFGRAPVGADILVIDKVESDSMDIAVQAADVAATFTLAELLRTNINPFIVDHNAQGGVPLSVTSPEILLTTGYIPALLTFNNDNGPTAFSDEATSVTAVAAVTGETIGTARSLSLNPKEPVYFTWDSAFAAKYLPLNTDASIVTHSSGTDESIVVSMSEGIHFLMSGGALNTSSLFSEIAQVRLADDHFMQINASYVGAFNAAISDGPFVGFLPGYDNTPYNMERHQNLPQYFADVEATRAAVMADIEAVLTSLRLQIDVILADMLAATDLAGVTNEITPDGVAAKQIIEAPFYTLIDIATQQASLDLDALDVLGSGFGYYDLGHPLVGFFQRAKELAALNVLPLAEDTELHVLLQRINPFLTNGDVLSTTLEQFQSALSLTLPLNTAAVPNFGIPAVGLGISIDEKPQGQAAADVLEAVVININDFGRFYDAYGYDEGALDEPADLLVQIYSQEPPPLPATGLASIGVGYAAFASPVFVSIPARSIEVGFSTPPGAIQFYIWLPSEAAPRRVEVVQTMSDRRFRLSIHVASEFKLIIV